MQKEENRTKYLLKNTTIFAISNLATKLITFFLVPLYTYCLTTKEYGIVDLLFTISTVLIPIITLNVVEAIYRFSMDKDADNNKIVSIGTLMFLICIIIGLAVIPILNYFPDYSDYKFYFYFFLVTSAGYHIYSVNLKGQEKLKLFSIGNILTTFISATLNIVFLKILKMKIEGYFIAYSISYLIGMIFSILGGKVINNIKHFTIDKKLFFKMAKYSVVLIPTSFMWWIMKASDRVMLTYCSGLALNGIYAISYKVPTILQNLASIFNQAWVFSAVKQKDKDDNELYTNSIFRTLYFFMFLIACGLILILKPFFSIYVSKDYYVAWKYVPFLLIGTIFVTLGTFISSSYNAHKDSKGFLFSGLFGAIANIILNFALIPKFEAYGAAIATCVSYIIVFVYRLFDTRKYVKIHFSRDYLYPLLIITINCILVYFNNIYCYIIQILTITSFIVIYYKDWITPIKNIIKVIKKRKEK